MKLKDCTYGRIVIDSGNSDIGMIIGITNNRPLCSEDDKKGADYAIPLVQWSTGRTTGIHQGNIEPYKGNA